MTHPHQETASGFTGPLRAELPLDYLEAFRLAGFGIEYQPRYAPVVVDPHASNNAWFWIGEEQATRLQAAHQRLATGLP